MEAPRKRTAIGDELHDAADRIVTSMLVDDDGNLIASDDERTAALAAGGAALDRYRSARDAQSDIGDVLAQAVVVFLDCVDRLPESEDDFGIALDALEMSRISTRPFETCLHRR